MTTFYDNSPQTSLFDVEKNSVSPKATRWLWGIFIFMVLMFFVTGVLSDRDKQKINQSEYIALAELRESLNDNDLNKAKEISLELEKSPRLSKNWSFLFFKARIAEKEGDLLKAKFYLDEIIKQNYSLSFAENEPNFLEFKFQILDKIKQQNNK